MHIIKSIAAMSCLLLVGCGEQPPNVNKTESGIVTYATSDTPTITTVAREHFETGLELGYLCAKLGGTTNDIARFAQAMRERKPEIIKAWIDAR